MPLGGFVGIELDGVIADIVGVGQGEQLFSFTPFVFSQHKNSGCATKRRCWLPFSEERKGGIRTNDREPYGWGLAENLHHWKISPW